MSTLPMDMAGRASLRWRGTRRFDFPLRLEIGQRVFAACRVTTIRQRWYAFPRCNRPKPRPILPRLRMKHDPPDDTSFAVVNVVVVFRP